MTQHLAPDNLKHYETLLATGLFKVLPRLLKHGCICHHLFSFPGVTLVIPCHCMSQLIWGWSCVGRSSALITWWERCEACEAKRKRFVFFSMMFQMWTWNAMNEYIFIVSPEVMFGRFPLGFRNNAESVLPRLNLHSFLLYFFHAFQIPWYVWRVRQCQTTWRGSEISVGVMSLRPDRRVRVESWMIAEANGQNETERASIFNDLDEVKVHENSMCLLYRSRWRAPYLK